MSVYVLGGLRTPIVTAGTKFKSLRPEIFGAEVLQALRQKFFLEHVDEIICGNAVGTGGNISRLMTLIAGFDESTAALTVDRQCAGGAASIAIGYAKISCGLADVIIAGGAESSSLQPLRVYHPNDERFNLTAVEVQGGYRTAQFSPNEFDALAMLKGAQRVADAENISKAELDAWAVRSHQRAAKSIENLRDYIVEIAGVREDTGIKKNISRRLIERAPLPLGTDTKISAFNACRINDGAAFVVLASEKFLREKKLSTVAKIFDVSTGGVNPLETPRGAQVVADKLLARNGLTYEKLSAIEFNEAFAVIDVLFERAHPNLIDKFNPMGGALAYGHPYGASGAILMIHLLASLKISGGLGLLSIAGAGGTGEAILVEALT
ncbi:MAG: thiolase family protein [Selenomonadaceae bacterium]|nr:thiolase family protein [Selenomonadaceae bacterium]